MEIRKCVKPSRRDILLEMLEKNRVLDFQFAVQQRAEKHSQSEIFCRQLCQQEIDRANDNGMRKSSEAVVLRKSEKLFETELANEMVKIRDAEDLEPRRRLQLRQNDPLLRQTEKQLRACYTKKEQIAQMADKQARKIEAEKEKQKEKLNFEYQEEKYKNDEIAKTKAMLQYEYRSELDKQMEEKGKMVVEQKYEDYIRQRDLVQYLMDKIRQEDREKLERKARRVTQEQFEMSESFRWKAEAIDQRKRDEELRLKNIAIARKKTDEELRQYHENRKKIYLEREKRTEELVLERIRQNRLEEDHHRLENAYLDAEGEEEWVHAEETKWKELYQKRLVAMRDEMINKQNAENSKKMAKADRENERRLFIESLEASEKIYRMKDGISEKKKKELKEQLLSLIREHRALTAQAKEKQKLDDIELMKIEAVKMKAVEYERDVMLKEHVPQLVGHIAPGILRVDDLGKFDETIQEMYQPKIKPIYP